jgi:hypothetical protein
MFRYTNAVFLGGVRVLSSAQNKKDYLEINFFMATAVCLMARHHGPPAQGNSAQTSRASIAANQFVG